MLAACGPESAGSETDGDAAGSEPGDDPTTDASAGTPTTGEAPPADACACPDGDCGEWLCAPITLGCEIDDDCDPDLWWGVIGEEHLECALAALRDRTPGGIQWARTTGFETGTDEEVALFIRPDGAVLRSPSFPNQCEAGPVTHGTLREPGYFAACLAALDARARFLCMIDALQTEDGECGSARPIACEPPPDPLG